MPMEREAPADQNAECGGPGIRSNGNITAWYQTPDARSLSLLPAARLKMEPADGAATFPVESPRNAGG